MKRLRLNKRFTRSYNRYRKDPDEYFYRKDPTHYETLGVNEHDELSVIVGSYRMLCFNTNPKDFSDFKDIHDSYKVLTSIDKDIYDSYIRKDTPLSEKLLDKIKKDDKKLEMANNAIKMVYKRKGRLSFTSIINISFFVSIYVSFLVYCIVTA